MHTGDKTAEKRSVLCVHGGHCVLGVQSALSAQWAECSVIAAHNSGSIRLGEAEADEMGAIGRLSAARASSSSSSNLAAFSIIERTLSA